MTATTIKITDIKMATKPQQGDDGIWIALYTAIGYARAGNLTRPGVGVGGGKGPTEIDAVARAIKKAKQEAIKDAVVALGTAGAQGPDTAAPSPKAAAPAPARGQTGGAGAVTVEGVLAYDPDVHDKVSIFKLREFGDSKFKCFGGLRDKAARLTAGSHVTLTGKWREEEFRGVGQTNMVVDELSGPAFASPGPASPPYEDPGPPPYEGPEPGLDELF